MKLKHSQTLRLFGSGLAALIMGGCAVTGPSVQVKSEILNPTLAKSKSVAVLSDYYMDDFDEADRLAGLVRDQLTAEGYKVSTSELDADLVVIPSIARANNQPTTDMDNGSASPAPKLVDRHSPLQNINQSGMMQTGSVISNLGRVDTSVATASPTSSKVGLLITAVTRHDFIYAIETGEVPRVWRVTAVGNENGKDDIVTMLMQAAAPKLATVATEAAAMPAPSPTPAGASHPAPSPLP